MSKSRMKNCKACGNEIAKNARVCPNCGARNKKKGWIWLLVILVVLIIIIVIAVTGNDKPKLVDDNGTRTSESANSVKSAEKTVFGVGERVELRNVICTLVSVTESEGSTYNKPKEENVFVLCEFEIENNTSSDIAISSMMSFEAYCDDYACSYSLAALMEKGNKNQLDGTVAAGKKMNGVVGYEVPSDWAELEVHFKPNIASVKEFVFVANHEAQ